MIAPQFLRANPRLRGRGVPYIYGLGDQPAPGFRFTAKTDNTGTSNNDQFTIPLYSGETYDFTVAYDGQETAQNTDSDLTLTFPSGAGTYDIVITGTFPGIFFNDGGDGDKLTKVDSFGTSFTRLDAAFYGCGNCLTFCCAIPYNAGITSLSSTWKRCSSTTIFPNISALTDVTTLHSAWFSCSSALSFPSVSALTDALSLTSAWRACSSATVFPDVSTLTDVTSLDSAWFSCSSATSFPDVSALTKVTTINLSWAGGTSCNTVPVLPSASTALTICTSAFNSIGSGMLGTVEELWNATNFPNISSFANFATGATGLTNYADIPDGWKGL